MGSKKKKSIEELLEEALVPEDEQPYQVPENWVWVKLEGYLENHDGARVPVSAKDRKTMKGNIPYYGASGVIDYVNSWTHDGKFVLVSEDGANLITRSKPISFVAEGKVWVNNHVHVLQGRGRVSEEYICNYINSIPLQNYVTGSAQPKLSQKNLNKIPIPIAPIKEQKRIVEKVERLFAKIDEAKRFIDDVKESFELRWESVLNKALRGELTKKWRIENPSVENAEHLYEKIQGLYASSKSNEDANYVIPYELPASWKWVRLGNIVQINPPRKKLENIDDQHKCTFIPMSAVSDETGQITSPEVKPFTKVKKGYTFFLEGDILFAKVTPCMENGKTAIAQNLMNGFGFGSTEFHVIRTNQYVNTKLLYYLLRSKSFRTRAKNAMTGAVGQQRVPKTFLEKYYVPLPPKVEQDKIVELLDRLYIITNKIADLIKLEEKIELTRQSTLNKAFHGELDTNDPSDGHAIDLLKEVLESGEE